MTERDHLLAALAAMRHAMMAAKADAPTLPMLLTAEEHLLRILFDESTVEEYLTSPGAKVYGR